MLFNRAAIDRFEDKFIPEPNSGCSLWLAAINNKGYGMFRVGSKLDGSRRNMVASRVAWMIYRGELSPEISVLHRCDNPACVNPDHLFLGTQTDNMQDCVAKGRVSRGERHSEIQRRNAKRGRESHLWGSTRSQGSKHGASKLTEVQVLAIRSDNRTGFELARQYGVSFQLISNIRRRKIWRHI